MKRLALAVVALVACKGDSVRFFGPGDGGGGGSDGAGSDGGNNASGALPAFGVGAVTSMVHVGTSWFVGGFFARVSPYAAPHVLGLDANALPSGCIGPVNGSVTALARSGGSYYMEGTFTHYKGQPVPPGLLKIDVATCAVDTSFAPQPGVSANTVVVAPSGIYLGGSFTMDGGAHANNVVKLDLRRTRERRRAPGVRPARVHLRSLHPRRVESRGRIDDHVPWRDANIDRRPVCAIGGLRQPKPVLFKRRSDQIPRAQTSRSLTASSHR